MGPPSRASSTRPPMVAPSRFPLMTPSASPPVHRPFSRQSSTPAPAKKRRVSRAPSVPAANTRSFSVASASSSSVSPAFNFDASVDPGEELDAARRASSFRVLNVWSQLAEKYARRLDEDDIVDLGDGTIIKDCGVLRSSEDTFEIGHFADEQENAERLEHDQPLTPADDEPDELDAFADIQDNVSRSETDGDEEDGLELAQHTKRLPPVREIDPADAADLAEFLRAEQLRRETFGDPDEEDEEDGENETEGEEEGETEYSEEVDAQEELDEDDRLTEFEAQSSGDVEEVIYQESVSESDGGKSRRPDYSRYSTPSGSPEFDILDLSHWEKDTETIIDADSRAEKQLGAAFNVDSDDELGGWDHDEGSTLYSVAGFSEELADREDGNVLKEISTNQSSKPRRKRSRASAEGKGQSVEQVADQHQSKSPLKKTSKQLSPSPPVTQLQTPPRSASFGPEERNNRIIATYSRKRRGLSSSPRKAPMRIQSTASESSASDADGEPSPSKNQYSPLPESPTKKMRLVPEVVIDARSPSPSKKAPKNKPADESRELSESPTPNTSAARERRTKAKGKARAVDVVQSASENRRREVELSSLPPETPDPATPSPRSAKDTARAASSKKTPLPSSKRRRGHSPAPEESYENERTVDVVMNSPSLSPVRSSSRRASSSRRSTIREIETYNDHEPGPSSPRPQTPRSRRSRSRPSTEHISEVQPRLHHLPELNAFSFTPPHAPQFGYQNYPPPHFPHPSGLGQQHSAPLPNFQDPNAQYHLAQALQSLSILMGGALPFPPSPLHTSHTSQQPPQFVPHGHHQAWPPYTPRHHNRTMNFDTPHSVASEPPPSSPLASDYSDSVPSSPTKQPIRERGRSQANLSSTTRDRPKSAIREARTRTRSRSRSSLRVSFSSPEATQIEDAAYEYVSDGAIEIKSSDEDSDMERRRLRREELSKRSSELHVRAQTPGPADRAAKTEFVEGGSRHSARRELGPKRKHSKASRPEEASRHQNGRRYR